MDKNAAEQRPISSKVNMRAVLTDNIPASFDWRNVPGVVNPIKQQGYLKNLLY